MGEYPETTEYFFCDPALKPFPSLFHHPWEILSFDTKIQNKNKPGKWRGHSKSNRRRRKRPMIPNAMMERSWKRSLPWRSGPRSNSSRYIWKHCPRQRTFLRAQSFHAGVSNRSGGRGRHRDRGRRHPDSGGHQALAARSIPIGGHRARAGRDRTATPRSRSRRPRSRRSRWTSSRTRCRHPAPR